MDFLYDDSGSPYSFVYDGIQYYYVKNLQGDVIQIRSVYGTLLVEYAYDAWGNVIDISGSYASTLGADNPIRYRSYYYDTETGFYYLHSRYYDPAIRRFINADDVSLLGANNDFASLNLYAYCGNNPVARADNGGTFWETAFDMVSLVFSVAEVVANPASPGAWIGLAGDAIDLIPFVSGVGEIVRFARIADNTLEVVDTIYDAGRATDKAGDAFEAGWKVGDDITQGY